MSEAARGPRFPRRGPRRKPAEARPSSSWDEAGPPVSPEHRDSLAEAERDAAYRWAAHAIRDRDVLVVGAGAGHGAALLAAAGARSVLGVDHDPRAIEIATRLYGERVRFLVAEPMALPLAAGSFDAVVCLDGLDEAPDRGAALSELTRVLTVDGVLAVRLSAIAGRDAGGLAPRYEPGSENGAAPAPGDGSLRARFAHARVHRLGVRVAATVTPVDAQGAVPIDETAWLAADEGEDRAALVVASNAELPDLPAVASLAGLRDLRAYRETLAAWEERARRAEAEGSAKHWELVAAREAQRRLRKRLFTLEHRPLRVLSRVVRGKPARIGPGPPIRASEREPEPWE